VHQVGFVYKIIQGCTVNKTQNLPLLYANCLEICVTSISWNPQGLSRPVMGFIYLFFNTFHAQLFLQPHVLCLNRRQEYVTLNRSLTHRMRALYLVRYAGNVKYVERCCSSLMAGFTLAFFFRDLRSEIRNRCHGNQITFSN